jgi:hypothetical protein
MYPINDISNQRKFQKRNGANYSGVVRHLQSLLEDAGIVGEGLRELRCVGGTS